MTGGHSGAAGGRDCLCPDPNPDCQHPTCPRSGAEAGAGGDEGLSLVEIADRDNPAEMAAAREWLAQQGGEPVQRRRRSADLDAVVAREIGGLGDGYVDPWAGGGAA